METPDLSGVAEEWDSSSEVREHMRVKKSLFSPALRMLEPTCSVPCGERNFEALKPLAKRLLLSDNTVGQVAVPLVEKENLDFIKTMHDLYVCVFVSYLRCFFWGGWIFNKYTFQRKKVCGSRYLFSFKATSGKQGSRVYMTKCKFLDPPKKTSRSRLSWPKGLWCC